MAEPTEVLSKLREFCGKYFKESKESEDGMERKELIKSLNTFVPTVVGKLCERLNSEVLDKEPIVVMPSGTCYVFGDLHGNLKDLFFIENKFWNNSECEKNSTFLFLGDFVDRGEYSTEVALYLLALKMNEPDKFLLIRGNHEVRNVNKHYTFHKECITKYGSKLGEEVWNDINTSFERLPIAAVIDKQVFCCHGGVPKSLKKIEELQRVAKPLIDPLVECPGVHELFWNDPIESMAKDPKMKAQTIDLDKTEFVKNGRRNTGYYYTALAVKRFLDTNQCSHMIRAHENIDEGFKLTSDDRVLTVFSSSDYCGKSNASACAKVTPDQIQIQLIKTQGEVKMAKQCLPLKTKK